MSGCLKPDLSLSREEHMDCQTKAVTEALLNADTDSLRLGDYIKMNDRRPKRLQSQFLIQMKGELENSGIAALACSVPSPHHFHILMLEEGFVIDHVTLWLQKLAESEKESDEAILEFFREAPEHYLIYCIAGMSYDSHKKRKAHHAKKAKAEYDEVVKLDDREPDLKSKILTGIMGNLFQDK